MNAVYIISFPSLVEVEMQLQDKQAKRKTFQSTKCIFLSELSKLQNFLIFSIERMASNEKRRRRDVKNLTIKSDPKKGRKQYNKINQNCKYMLLHVLMPPFQC